MFSLSLSKDILRVEPGNAVTLALTVQNKGDVADRFEIEIDGLDNEWCAIPVPSFTLLAGEEKQQKVLIKPPRSAESKAGTYPFIVKVRSLETGEAMEGQCVLEVEAFSLVSVEIEPRRETAGFFSKQAHYRVSLINLGNVEQNLQLFADDPEDGCTYQFAHDRVQLAPGQQKQVALTVQPTHFPLVGSSRLFGFSVSARDVEDPHVSASAQAQIERKATVSPGFLILVLLLFVVGFGFYLTRPQPPKMESFAADRTEVLIGESVTLEWSASNANKVTIESSEGTRYGNLPAKGRLEVTITAPTTTFYAWAFYDQKRSDRMLELSITGKTIPPVPLPEITAFSVSPSKTEPGKTVTVTYKVNNATRIDLQPLGATLPTNLDSYRFIAPAQEDTYELTLVAYNSAGQAVRRSATLIVQVPSKATIVSFKATYLGQPLEEQEIEPGTPVTLEWVVSNAARGEIDPPVQGFSLEQSSVAVTPEKTTVYLLTVYDTDNRPVSQRVTVRVKGSPAPTPPRAGGTSPR